jgi:beta-phosphoglucomutase
MKKTEAIPYQQIPTLDALKNRFPGLKALFFDMDGTLFDTERFHTQAFLKIGKDFKITPPHSLTEIHKMLVGKADHLVFDVVRTWPNFPGHWTAEEFVTAKTQNLLELLQQVPPESFFPADLRNLLREAKNQKIFVALVTSSEKIITHRLLKMAKVENLFDLLVTRDDSPHHKPDPWPYLHALKNSQTLPEETVIFEDSEVGLTSAIESGCHVIKVEWHGDFNINTDVRS